MTKPKDLWQARVSDDWRFYLVNAHNAFAVRLPKIVGDVYRLEEIRKHPK